MRLIDADALDSAVYADWTNDRITNAERLYIRQAMNEAPTVDAVPVIRCKDCERYEIVQLKKDGTDDRRYKPTWCTLWRSYMSENDFCSYAERREND